jgi:alpha-L-rhamnosidase
MRQSVAPCFVLGVALLAPLAAAEGVVRLRTNAAAEPLGIDTPRPRFSWALESERRGVMQTAYRVRVVQGRATVWDSGRVASQDPFVTYAGPPLGSRTRYQWSVRTWASGGMGESRSRMAGFETAFLDPAEWRGHWIAGPERPRVLTAAEGESDDARIRAAGELCRPVGWLKSGFASRKTNDQGECRELRPAPMLRRSFRLGKPVARARVYSSGLAYNRLTINGTRTSDSVLDPGFTNYSKSVLYTTHDVTALLRAGENVIATELGSGHFDDATRTWDWGWDEAEWRATPRLRLELHVTYADGSEEAIRSDASWRASTDGPRRYDSLYLGETYDARREIPGWNLSGFDDSGWAPARVVEGPAGALRAPQQEPIRVVDVRPPGQPTERPGGVIVYDVGQNLTGWAEVRVRAPRGAAVEIFYSEKLAKDGKASSDGNGLVYGQLQTDYYVAKGAGEESWTPAFSYKGFQYVQLSGVGGGPLPPDVSVSVTRIQQVRSDLARRSSFESSSATLDRIHRNTTWAIQGNFHGVITDTPVYEKNAWTGDAQLTAGTATLLFDTERLYRKLFRDMLDAQAETGEVPLLCPSNQNYGYVGKPAFKPVSCCGATPPWDAFWFVVPWESYRRHGDLAAIATVYPAMRRYLDLWIPRWTDKDGDAFAQTLTSGLGDWVAPAGIPTHNALSSTAYYAHMVRIARDAARALGDAADALRYAALFEKIRADFNARFLGEGEEGYYREKPGERFFQTAQILPLAFGLVPDERRAALASRLAEDIREARGGNAWVGVLGARDVLPVLTAAGHHDAAFTAATQIDEPSWGFWTDIAGFTALGEHWPADTRSRNHHFFGAIVEWFYEDLAGIRPLEPGYRKIEIAPRIPSDGLDFVKASYDSVRGTIAVAWQRTPAGVELDVTIPPNTTARVVLGAETSEVGSGRYRFVAAREPAGRRPAPRSAAAGSPQRR